MLETTNNEEYKWFEKRIVSIFELPYTVDPDYCEMRKLLEKENENNEYQQFCPLAQYFISLDPKNCKGCEYIPKTL